MSLAPINLNKRTSINEYNTYLGIPQVQVLNRGDITVLMDSNWSQGLVLLVDARKRNLKESICFKLTIKC